jgi:hypothetical protein
MQLGDLGCRSSLKRPVEDPILAHKQKRTSRRDHYQDEGFS